MSVDVPYKSGFTNLKDIPSGTDMTLVFRMLEERIERLETQLMWEEELRRQNPALQDLFEKYQLIKRLS